MDALEAACGTDDQDDMSTDTTRTGNLSNKSPKSNNKAQDAWTKLHTDRSFRSGSARSGISQESQITKLTATVKAHEEQRIKDTARFEDTIKRIQEEHRADIHNMQVTQHDDMLRFQQYLMQCTVTARSGVELEPRPSPPAPDTASHVVFNNSQRIDNLVIQAPPTVTQTPNARGPPPQRSGRGSGSLSRTAFSHDPSLTVLGTSKPKRVRHDPSVMDTNNSEDTPFKSPRPTAATVIAQAERPTS